MEQYFWLLRETPLFAGISEDNLEKMLGCLGAAVAAYPKGSILFLAGNPARRVGVVCEGGVQVVREDFFGNRAILAQIGPGDTFGEVFACARVDILPVSVTAARDSTVLLLDYRRIVTTCPASCGFHSRLIENMLGLIAQKNLMLNQKIEVLSARSTRDKLMTYLSAQGLRTGSGSFQIPFNRQELADYLSVDRSAMSAELGRMRDEGILRYHKNAFELLLFPG